MRPAIFVMLAVAVAIGVAAAILLGDDDGGSQLAATTQGCKRPYSAASPWNQPIGRSPRIHPDSNRQVARIEGRLTSDPTQYTYPVYEVSSRTELRTVDVQGSYTYVDRAGRRGYRAAPTLKLPIPDGAESAEGSDAQIILLDRERKREWGALRLERTAGGWQAENVTRYPTTRDALAPADPDGGAFLARGAGIPYLAGLVRVCEVARERIDHALAFGYDYPSGKHIYPASKSDGRGGPRALPEGSRLQLDPSIDKATLSDWGCTGPCMTIARALQRYGMYVVDNAGRPKVYVEYEETARWRGTIEADTVSPIPLSRFRVIVSCTVEGTPRDEVLRGTPGRDLICGASGDDRLSGLGGADVLIGGHGSDRLLGGGGADRIEARDGESDLVRGGAGRDHVRSDRRVDRVRD